MKHGGLNEYCKSKLSEEIISVLDQEIKSKQFCFTEEEKILAPYNFIIFDENRFTFKKGYRQEDVMEYKFGYGTRFFYPEGEWADPEKWENGTYFIEKSGRFIGRNFESLEAAKEFVLEMNKDEKSYSKVSKTPEKKKRKRSFVPKQLMSIKREGSDFRKETDIAGEDYLRVFGFKGGEFGNWLNEKDRQASLNFGYEALLDMCQAIGINPEDISLGGRLSIAFGSRGSGNVLAHYEPLREVINITKMKGAGSLAHEWGHALDDIIGKELGLKGMMSENPHKKEVPEAFRNLLTSFRYKEVRDEAALRSQKGEADKIETRLREFIDRYFYGEIGEENIKIKDELINKLIELGKTSGTLPLEMVITGKGCSEIDALSSFRKSIKGHVIPKAGCIEIAHFLNRYNSAVKRIGESKRVKTDFYQNSIKFDSLHSKTDHGYYQSTIEMFARAFACYVKDKLEEKGMRSDYLCGHADLCVSSLPGSDGKPKIIKAIPEGDERKEINKNFDLFFDEMRERGILHNFEKTPEPTALKKYTPTISELIQKRNDKKSNMTLEEKIRRGKEQEQYIEKNIHETKKGQLEFNLFQ